MKATAVISTRPHLQMWSKGSGKWLLRACASRVFSSAQDFLASLPSHDWQSRGQRVLLVCVLQILDCLLMDTKSESGALGRFPAIDLHLLMVVFWNYQSLR